MSSDNPFGSSYTSPGVNSSSTNPRGGGNGGRPQYMTVGSGSTSESAARLQSILDEDSGYGGSMTGDGNMENAWHPGPSQDRFTPAHTPMGPGDSEHERKALASHVHQLFYNQNRTALGRAINQTVETMKKLQEINAKWPAHYPMVQSAPSAQPQRQTPRPGLHHTQSTMDNQRGVEEGTRAVEERLRPGVMRRANTSLGDAYSPESSGDAAKKEAKTEPRLVTPQLAQEFSVLKIELKMEGLPQTEIVHSLEKSSVASLLDNQINNSIRHLFSLRERIEDTSSKVLVTGDLNAGKSTFCNALLRRKILPEDQQPCTSIFCEVLDARENTGVEEVHAIPHGFVYNRNDESTYQVYPLKQLEDIVIDGERWSQCKVYIRDIRPVDQSLLNNGVVDIALIDAPGLNNDSLKTTAVFARQEEIDVVVFVVSAANHFTLSAKEFIFNAAREKAYMFMVVNGFDQIRDQKRCQEMILKQVAHLSPATFKESSELVHFVSSNAIPVVQGGGPGSGGSGGSGFGGSSSDGNGKNPAGDDDDNDSDSGKHGEPGSPPKGKGKGKQKEQQQDFDELEASLRRFVLEKRARSKLAPAKTYLMNVLGDLSTLASVNKDVAQNEYDRVTKELQELEPVFEKSKKARSQADEDVATQIESTAQDVYDLTRGTLNSSIAHVAENDLGVEYPGIFGAYNYADDLKVAMLNHITETVRWCEARGREKTVQGVSGIKQLGILHLGDSYTDLTFRSEKMFNSKRDALVRQVDFEPEVMDFFDFTSIWERQEKVASTSMAVTVAGVVGTRMVGGVGWLDGALTATKLMGSNNMRRLILPGILLTGKFSVNQYPQTSILTFPSQPSSVSATPCPKSHTPSRAVSQQNSPLNSPPSTTPTQTPPASRLKSAARSNIPPTSCAKACNATWKTCKSSARRPPKSRTRARSPGNSSET
jgi:mitofusin